MPSKTLTPTTTAPSTRMAWPDVAKGICILLVVLHHLVHKQMDLVVPLGLEHWQDRWADLTWMLKPVRMPLFFLVSGFFAARAIHRPWAQVRRRVVSPAWLYLVWLPLLTAFLAVETLVPANRPQSWTEFAGQLALPATSLWFLHAMAAYFLLARALRHLPAELVVAVAAALSASVSLWGIEENNRVAFLSHFVYFAFGALLPDVVVRVADARPPLRPLVLVYAAATVLVFLAPVPLTVGVLLLSVPGIPLGIAVAQLLAPTALGGALAWLGRRTLQVYVLHLFVIGLTSHLPVRIGPDPGTFELLVLALYPLVGTLVVTAACLLGHRVLCRLGLGLLFRPPALLAGGRTTRTTA